MRAPIRLLQVAKSSGGVGVYMRDLVESLDKQKYEITAVCLAEGSDELAERLSRQPNVNAISIPMKDNIDPLSDLKVCWELGKIIRGQKFDLIHAHTSKPGFFTRLMAIGSGIPVIYQPANFAFHDGVSRSQALVYGVLERLAARYLTDRIIAVCNGERELARRYAVGSDALFTTVYTGINLDKFDVQINRTQVLAELGIPANAKVVGTVARLTEAKAPQDFIHAAKFTHEQNPDAHFLWVGSGPLESDARNLTHSLGLDEVFHFPGHRTNIPEILKAMDCFVLSSHWEGFSIAILEAMAAELPIISTRVMGAAEAICDNETGLLVPIGDTQALANAMLQLINNPPLARAYGKAARKRAEMEFPYSKMITRIESVYRETLQTYSSKHTA